jgi:hypothetical protein
MARTAILAAALGAAAFAPALYLVAGALAMLAIIAFLAIFAPEKYRKAALDVLKAIFGRKS